MASENKILFHQESVQELPLPAGQPKDYWDTRVHGLYVRVYPTGSKVFYFRRSIKGKSYRERLGDFTEMTVNEARALASEKNASVERGVEVKKEVVERTFAELFDDYYAFILPRTKRPQQTKEFYEREMKSFKNLPVSSITRDMIQKWVDKKGQTGKKATAKRALDVMKAIIKFGIKNDIIQGKDPTMGVVGFRLMHRQRYMRREDEFPRFRDALEKYPDETIRDFFWMCYFTGARKSNVLQMCWNELDLDNGVWNIPAHKAKSERYMSVALAERAVEMLRERRKKVEEGVPWVFPSPRTSKEGHLVSVKDAWRQIMKEAKLEDFRIHDLRHTLGTWMAIDGHNRETIAGQLGHAQNSPVTSQYITIANGVKRAAVAKTLENYLPTRR
jgi:integrase